MRAGCQDHMPGVALTRLRGKIDTEVRDHRQSLETVTPRKRTTARAFSLSRAESFEPVVPWVWVRGHLESVGLHGAIVMAPDLRLDDLEVPRLMVPVDVPLKGRECRSARGVGDLQHSLPLRRPDPDCGHKGFPINA